MAVTMLDGQLSRTWNYVKNGGIHVIVLYHDPLTGVRSAMLDHEEILGSLGNSSIFMEKTGHRILFSVKGTPAYIEIKRSGWMSFEYECFVGGEKQIEITQAISQNQGRELYDIKIAEHRSGSDGYSEDTITWYLIETTRLADGYTNTVHRRFKDFATLHADVQQQFKGHHLLSSLPTLPEKKAKFMVDHTDPAFLAAREHALQTYLTALIRIPHVTDLVSTKAFIGLMEKVRETSMIFTSPTIGVTLIPCDSPGTPAVVGFIQNTEACSNLLAGDIVSKINGTGTGGLTFNGVVRMLKHLPRPIVVHFVQALAYPSPTIPPSNAWKGDNFDSDRFEESRHLPSFSADNRDSAVFSSEQSRASAAKIPPSQLGGEDEYVSFPHT